MFAVIPAELIFIWIVVLFVERGLRLFRYARCLDVAEEIAQGSSTAWL